MNKFGSGLFNPVRAHAPGGAEASLGPPAGRRDPEPICSPSLIPHPPKRQSAVTTPRGGEGEFHAIQDPELRAAFMAAHRGWARRWAPWLLEEQHD